MAKDEAYRLFEEGSEYLGRAMYQQALDACDKAFLAIDPNNLLAAGVWTLRGLVLVDLGRHQEAVESFNNAIAIYPNDEVAWSSKATALLLLGRYQESVESSEKALRLEPDFPSTDFEGKSAFARKLEALDRLEEWLKARRPPNVCMELFQLVGGMEERLHIFISHRLKKALGDNESQWWAKGIPKDIRTKCQARREDSPRREPVYNYTDLIDLKDIMDANWRFFNEDFQRVKGKFKSKKEFLDGVVRLKEIRNIVMHPVRSPPTGDDFDFARQIREVVEQFCGPG